MQRRQLLKMVPLAALATLPLKTEGAQPVAYEVRKDKKYIFVFDNGVSEEYLDAFSDCAKSVGIKGMAIIGEVPTVYEVDAR